MLLSPVLSAVEAGSYLQRVEAAIPLLILMLAWGRLITWCDKDAVAVNLPRLALNMVNMGMGVAGLFLFFMLPGFLGGVGGAVCVHPGGRGSLFPEAAGPAEGGARKGVCTGNSATGCTASPPRKRK